MKKLDKNLSDLLGIDSSENSDADSNAVVDLNHIVDPPASDVIVDADAAFARENIKNLIKKGSQAADRLIKVAEESEHPRAYEVFTGMLKTLADMNKDLLELQKRKQDLLPKQNAKSELNINKAVVFTGTTSELLKVMRDNKEKDVSEDD
jgi:hypothetical protein